MLDMPYIKVYEVATFYSMYNLTPVGDYFFQVCTTTPCMIRGAYKLVDVCKKKISENESEISKNGKSSWMEVECLGACVNSPMVQINDDYFEDLDEEKFSKIIDQIDNNFKENMLSDIQSYYYKNFEVFHKIKSNLKPLDSLVNVNQ